VVNRGHQLRGVISIHDVKELFQSEDALRLLVIAQDLAQRNQAVVNPEETLAQCLEKFTRTEQEYLAVVSSGGVLRGYISRGDVLDLYQQEILRHEYLGLNLYANGVNGGVFEHLRLPYEYTVEVIPVPPFLVGQTLRDAQLRTRYRLTVVAVRRGGFDRPDELPDPNWTLGPQDYVVLVGHQLDMQLANSQEVKPDDAHALG
jgi:hypothetical protein